MQKVSYFPIFFYCFFLSKNVFWWLLVALVTFGSVRYITRTSALTRIYDKQREEAADADRALKRETLQSANVGVKREREED